MMLLRGTPVPLNYITRLADHSPTLDDKGPPRHFQQYHEVQRNVTFKLSGRRKRWLFLQQWISIFLTFTFFVDGDGLTRWSRCSEHFFAPDFDIKIEKGFMTLKHLKVDFRKDYMAICTFTKHPRILLTLTSIGDSEHLPNLDRSKTILHGCPLHLPKIFWPQSNAVLHSLSLYCIFIRDYAIVYHLWLEGLIRSYAFCHPPDLNWCINAIICFLV